jgi:hypothetical protein
MGMGYQQKPLPTPQAKCDLCGKVLPLSSFARCTGCGRATCYYCLTVKVAPKFQCYQCAMGLTDAEASMGGGTNDDDL